MGGFGSGRWWLHMPHETTDDGLPLDVRWLARHGYLAEPGQVVSKTVTWERDGAPAGAITVCHDGDMPERLLVDYVTVVVDHGWRSVAEPIKLERTPCHFGGSRIWFRCSGCDTRRAILYGLHGRFRCRSCHGLTYISQRTPRRSRSAS